MHTYVQSETREKCTFENAIIRINRNEKWKKVNKIWTAAEGEAKEVVERIELWQF